MMKRWQTQSLRLLALLLLCLLALQLFFALRIASMRWIGPESTAFERSEAWRLLTTKEVFRWRQEWVDATALPAHMKRAVIASEDAGFADHHGVEWEAIENAWRRNEKARARAEKLQEQAEARRKPGAPAPAPPKVAKIIGGSTITQQLAKNLFLSGERTVVRKAQEFAITFMLEGLLSKQRILDIYLNHVELGEGVFGVQAAAQHYYRIPAAQLSPAQAARLAVMLPAPKKFEKTPGSAYVSGRSATVLARMPAVELPP